MKTLLIISTLGLLVSCAELSNTEINPNEEKQISQTDNVSSEVKDESSPENFLKIVNDNHAIVHTQVLINAPIDSVWKIATNFDDLSWSPVFKGLEGDVRDGEISNLMIQTEQGIQRFPQTITWVEGQRFGWKGASNYGDFLHDNHMYCFVSINDSTTLFIQSDQATCTDPSKMKLSDPNVVEQFKNIVTYNYMAFNVGLKKRVEGETSNAEQAELIVEVNSSSEMSNLSLVVSPYRAINHAEILIDAPVNEVWKIATEFSKYSEWSSTYQNLIGEKKEGNTVQLVVKGENGNMEFPMHLRWVEEQRFGWSGGNHSYDNHMFLFVPVGENQTLFIQTDDLTNTDGSKTDFTEENTSNFLKMVFENNFVGFNNELSKRVEKVNK